MHTNLRKVKKDELPELVVYPFFIHRAIEAESILALIIQGQGVRD